MTESNAKNEVLNIPVRITEEELENWENQNKNLKTVLTSKGLEVKLWEGYSLLKSDHMNEMVAELTFEKYSDSIRYNLTANFISRYLRDILIGKTIEDTESETILDDQWLREGIRALTTKMFTEFKSSFGEDIMMMGILASIVSGFGGCDDDDEEDE